MSCCLGRKACAQRARESCGKPKGNFPQSLAAIVDAYIRDYRAHAQSEQDYWASHGDLNNTVRAAALSELSCGCRHGHQHRIPRSVLQQAADKLTRAGISSCTTFADIHDAVETSIGCIWGIGELTVYDIAVRIGAKRGLKPCRVYLHAGTREGARTLGLGGYAIQKSAFPSEFSTLTPGEIEDCLCIFKADLQRLNMDRASR